MIELGILSTFLCNVQSQLGGVHKLRLHDFSFFTFPPPFTFLWYKSLRYKSLQKVNYFDHPPSSCERALISDINFYHVKIIVFLNFETSLKQSN